MGKYVVIKELLNVRNRPILKDETFVGTLSLGDEVDLVDETIEGEVPPGTDDNNWHTDTLNRFFSRPGVALKGTYAAKKAEFTADASMAYLHNNSQKEEDWKVSWGHVDLEIWKIWRDYKIMGEGIKIAIIDSGITTGNPDLIIPNLSCHYSPKDEGNFIDTDGHGTMCAGIVGAEGINKVFGVAPKSEILITKIYDQNGDASPESIVDALRWALKQKADVVSMSFTTENNEEVTRALIDLSESGAILLAAIGNAGEAHIIDDNVYPACQNFCYAVGALSKDVNGRYRRTTPSRKLKFLLPGEKILTMTLTSADQIGVDASISTPFLAGIVGMLLQLIKEGRLKIPKEELLKNVYDSGLPIIENIGNTELEYRIPQPYSLLNNLSINSK